MADNVFHGFDEAVKQQIREYLRSVEITEEQNYNMIDGRMNNLPNKSRKIGEKISVLDRLHLKQAEIARRNGKSVPQIEKEMEQRRK